MLSTGPAARRALPSIDRLLSDGAVEALVARFGRPHVVETLRALLDVERNALSDPASAGFDHAAFVQACAERMAQETAPSLKRVYNLTGTVLHTNLGRALMPESAARAVMQAMTRPVNLEFDLDGGARGERDAHIERWLTRLTGAEAAAVVNNNAAAVYLALNALAARKEVIVSRGELIEIGGAFRIPDIMARSGCKLREVGTTNRTHLSDYAEAVGPRTGAIMKVHTSNYTVQGFTASVSERELAALAHEHALPLIVDLGSGMLVNLEDYGLPHEPTPREALAHGADVVTFSGDKLLGGPQAGLIVGRKEFVTRIRKNPMKRALRVDKMTLAALDAVLQIYSNPATLKDELPTLRHLSRSRADIEAQAERLLAHLEPVLGTKAHARVAACASQIGSGSLPVDSLPSAGIAVEGASRNKGSAAQRIAIAFRALPVPVIGRVKDGAFLMDLRCLEDEAEFAAQLVQPGTPMIVATAGHIDHGKTLLVKTLTGVDTDRLPEEKARGISIDLGFAYLPLATGGLIGFVDVPGHERFIRNMLAGVCGIDFALLVVAADDGVMPQTIEHLHILDLLHVPRGAAVITKTDRVDAARVREVEQSVCALLEPTALAGSPVLRVSAVTGDGIAGLRDLLIAEAARQSARQTAGQHFRYAVDRTFSVPGSGTVVTGTVFSGSVKAGDRLTVSPSGTPVRVRGIQIQGKSADKASAGDRCALNLTGIELDAVHRGDWVLAPEIHKPTQRLDARVTVLAGEAHALEHWTPVHLHLATSDVTARVATRRGDAVAPGASAVVQLVLDQPIGALRGDRFILRDQSATRTVGGGYVLDPFAPATRRSSRARLAELAALEHEAPDAALAALLQQEAPAIDLGRFELVYNLATERAGKIYESAKLVVLGKDARIAITQARHGHIRDAVIAHVSDFHRRQPQAAGEDVETLRAAVAPDLSADAFSTVLRRLTDERKIETSSSTVRLPGHNATANAADDRLWESVRPALEGCGFNAPPVRDLAAQVKLKEAVLKDFLYRKAKTGEVMRVTGDRFYPRTTLATLAAIAQATAQAQAGAQFTAAQYRDATGVGRSLAIEILEFLDSLGITQRVGDARKMRKDFVPILGAAIAPPPPPKAQDAAKTAVKPNAARRPQQHYRR